MNEQKRFNTEKVEARMKKVKLYSTIMIVFGVVIIAFKDFDQIKADGAYIGAFLDSAVFISLGALTYFTTLKQEKSISGSYLSFEKERISFKSDQIERELPVSDLTNIEIKLKSIELETAAGDEYSINLEHYAEVKDKKAIKSYFENMRQQID